MIKKLKMFEEYRLFKFNNDKDNTKDKNEPFFNSKKKEYKKTKNEREILFNIELLDELDNFNDKLMKYDMMISNPMLHDYNINNHKDNKYSIDLIDIKNDNNDIIYRIYIYPKNGTVYGAGGENGGEYDTSYIQKCEIVNYNTGEISVINDHIMSVLYKLMDDKKNNR